jgi:hypothetical protein
MSVFRTTFSIPESTNKITLDSQLLTLGSCFAEVVGNQLKNQKLAVDVNPFGTLFNPLSIFKLLSPAYTKPDERLFVENHEQWYHHDFHSNFVSSNVTDLTQKLNSTLTTIHGKLPYLNHLVITFGTAFTYKLVDYPVFVANCHKMPAKNFQKVLLSVKDICKSFAHLHAALKQVNPNLKITLTVSPVRHTKDGMAENQVSKSILRAACHYLVADYEEVDYFPSYEIMMDDLRDYRFYKADLIHPNEVAEAYIFEAFSKTYFSESLISFGAKWQKIKTALAHRPFNPDSLEHRKFLQKLLIDLQDISSVIAVSTEIEDITSKLNRYKTNI